MEEEEYMALKHLAAEQSGHGCSKEAVHRVLDIILQEYQLS